MMSRPQGVVVSAALRERLRGLGIEPVLFDGTAPMDRAALAGTTHLLASIPADPDDPALRHHEQDIAAIDGLEWIGYLSTTSVYGVTDGSRVDEDYPCAPTSAHRCSPVAAVSSPLNAATA